MRFFSGLISLLSILAILLCTGCDNGGSDYFFEKPAAFSSVSGITCSDGSTSYLGFVVDNTKKYGARIMKISGCAQKIDKKFKDKRDKKTGIYVGGTGVSADQIIISGEAIIAVASTGSVVSDHWKDKKKEEMQLEPHKGRIVLRKLTNEIEHDKEFNRSYLLDFYPETVKAYGTEGFFFTGSDFSRNYIGFVDAEGNGTTAETDFAVSDVVIIKEKIYLFDKSTGSVYLADKDLTTENVKTSEDFIGGRMTGTYGKRIAFFAGAMLEITDSELNTLNTLEFPAGLEISAVSAAYYGENYKYRKFDDTIANEKVAVFGKEFDEFEESGFDPESWETINAEEGDIIWIATKSGVVRAYDFANSSWLIEPFRDRTSDTVYEKEVRPYLASSTVSYTKNGETTNDNVARVDSVKIARNIPSAMYYRFTYEGLFEGSASSGTYDASANTITDERADFEAFELDPSTDYAVFLNRTGSDECQIPKETNVIVPVQSGAEGVLALGSSEWSADIEKCFGNPVKYAIFAKGLYAVSRETPSGIAAFAGRASELGTEEEGESFSDDFISVNIRRTADDFATEKETSFYLKAGQGVPFVGFSSADIVEVMKNPATYRFVAFSPLTRRIIEYDMFNDNVKKVYK